MPGFRVLHVTDYASAYEGAFIRQLRMLDEEIRQRDGRESAICLTRAALARPWVQTLRSDGWQIREVPDGTPWPERRVAGAIAAAILELRPDVVHVHFGTFDLSARAAMRRVRRQLGGDVPKLVWHYRTALETTIDERSALRRWKDWLKYDRGGENVDLIVGVTRALADEVVERGAPRDRTRGIVAGCDTDTFRHDSATRRRVRDALGIGDDDVLLMHMGWSWHRKGGDLLAEAVRSIEAADGPRVVACSIGAPEDAVLGPVRPLPITDRVHEYHQAADIFISASRSEGFGNGLVEAMACERVAIAAAAGGQRETFAGLDGVVTIPVDDAVALARAVRTLVDHRSGWPPLGATNRRHVIDRHSMRRWARDMADAYAELVPEHIDPARKATVAVEVA